MTEKEIQECKDKIDNMSQEDMARLWRFAPSRSPYFDVNSPVWEHFKDKFEGFTPELSKSIGWS
jgi:hypothetical protein